MQRRNYEDATEYPDTYQIPRYYPGIAFYVLGWETEPDENTEWSGYENRTGSLVCIMVGDDRHFSFEEDDVQALSEDDFCNVCGQIGCGHGTNRDS